jgi:surface carbohydrate biosynthesis protein
MVKNFIKKVLVHIPKKFDFYRPKKDEVLLFRANEISIKVFSEVLDMQYVGYLEFWHEKINIYVLLSAMFHMNKYYDEYVRIVNPKLLLTYTDNAIIFYKIKIYGRTSKVAVQNGYRSEFVDIFGKLKKYRKHNLQLSSDYIFCFNQSVAKKFCTYIETNTTVIGSFLNNKAINKNKNKNKNIVLISTYVNGYEHPDDFLIQGLSWREYMKNEKLLFEWLFNYLHKLGYQISVLGAVVNKKDSKKEKQYYSELFKEIKFDFIPKTKNRNTYNLIDSFDIAISTDSTLGYEALVRGCKVAVFAGMRGYDYPLCSTRFGWPGDITEQGFFWTNTLNKDDWKRVVDYVIETSLPTWKKSAKTYIDEVMGYDKCNKKFISLMQKFEVPLAKSIKEC